MKVICKTVYENVDQEWLDWYIKRLSSQPELVNVAEKLNEHGFSEFISKDPSSNVVGKTTYEVTV